MQPVLLLAESRPVLLGFHVQENGKPFAAAWQRYLDRLFADLDRDGDGVLSKGEAARAPSVEFLTSFLQGGLPLESAGNRASFEWLDVNRDGRVSREEFAGCYRACGFDRMQVVAGPDRDQAAALTDTLFALLDRNRDGQLSKDELNRAGEVLRRIDLNEDEWITAEELLLHRSPQPKKPMSRATLETIGLLPADRAGLSPERSRLVLDRYAKSIRLDGLELTRLLSNPPEVELIARLGTVAPGEAASDLGKPAVGRICNPSYNLVRTREGGLLVTIEAMALELSVEKRTGGRVRGLHAFYRQQFEAADADRRGFLERKQAEDTALAALFPLADRNGDGRLTDREFDAFLDLHVLGAESFVTLTVTDQSLGLFDLLDEDGDGRLSLRELHTAWDRLRRFDRDGDGRLGRAEFPRRLQLRCNRGTPASRPAGVAKTAPESGPQRGPAWFRKMDRNGDGFVSRREFLGPDEVFKQLDVNGDGLISPEEASGR